MAVAIAGFPREVAAGNAHDKGKTKASTSHDQGWPARSAVDSRRSWQCQHRHHAAEIDYAATKTNRVRTALASA